MPSPSTRRRLSDYTRQDRELPDDVLKVGADSPFGNGSMPEDESGGSHTNHTSETRTGRRDLTHDVLQVFGDRTMDNSTTGRSNSSLQSQLFDIRRTRRRSVPEDVLQVFDERVGSEGTEPQHDTRRSHHSSVPDLYASRTRKLPDSMPQGVDQRPGGENSNHADGDRSFHHSYDTETRSSQHPATSNLANSMMRTVVSSGNDALNILFEAAVAHSQENMANEFQSQSQTIQDNASHGRAVDNSATNPPQFKYPTEALAKAKRPVQLSPASEDVLKVWETCRFVRMGWFTSREAVTLIDLYVNLLRPCYKHILTLAGFSRTWFLYPRS